MKLITILFPLLLSGCANFGLTFPSCTDYRTINNYTNQIRDNPIHCIERVGLGFRIEF